MHLLEHVFVATVVLTAITSTLGHSPHLEALHKHKKFQNPCRFIPGIKWIRSPSSCRNYFMCVAGRPITMPPCPKGHVWSQSGRNCVPEDSHWNDCPDSLSLLLLHDDPAGHVNSTAMTALVDRESPEKIRRDNLLALYPEHPCAFSPKETLLPHPDKCHAYYNCSLEAGLPEWQVHEALTRECPYPQLFSLARRACLPHVQVDCGTRKEFKAPCDYRDVSCDELTRNASCVGKADGNYSFPHAQWKSPYFRCVSERTLLPLDECSGERPVFSPESRQCESLMLVPKEHGGFRPVCRGRLDGQHPDETGRCDLYFTCRGEEFQQFHYCTDGRFYDPQTSSCTSSAVAPPCGRDKNQVCKGLPDGQYADPFGRCWLYMECEKEKLRSYLKCAVGNYSPLTGRCELSSDVPAPCGPVANPCLQLQDGAYPDTLNHCLSWFRCKNHYVIAAGVCESGAVFSQAEERCLHPNAVSRPCGLAPDCAARGDGFHPAPLRGCQHYAVCEGGRLQGHGKCAVAAGGFYFNPTTRACDFPDNICGPCGSRTDCEHLPHVH